jgi:peptidylprolyl isomerase
MKISGFVRFTLACSAVAAVLGMTGCEKSAQTPTTPAATGDSTAQGTSKVPSGTPRSHAVNPDAKDQTHATPESKPNPTAAPTSTPNPTPAPSATPKEPAPVTPPTTPVTTKKELPGGLILEDLVVGTGVECKPDATVTIHYRGTLENGEEFDSSYKRGRPATFPLPNLIKGWQQGIPGMKVGGKRKLTIPYPLAYGEAGRPPTIPPKATLIFEIEMFDTK